VSLSNPERDDTNPSTAFGRPISDEVKDFDKFAVGLIKNVVFDTLFHGSARAYARFYALETIARMPYFAYTSVLHFLETFGHWRKVDYLKIHFAEDWNELHHLLIMEELGGNQLWFDRFVAQHIALVYYFMVFVAYLYNPTLAYNLNESVEEHAYHTYDQFLTENEDELKSLPAPKVAQNYYRDGDLYMFDEFQTGTCEPRRPKMDTLYDCFVAIRDDEKEHVETMAKLQTSVQLTTPHSFPSMEECIVEELYAKGRTSI
jgi:ubiquinol oxidase